MHSRSKRLTAVAAFVVMSGGAGFATTTPTAFATACPGSTYTAVKNDGWSTIAAKVKVTMPALLAANSATTATPLHPGMELCLPTGANGPATTKQPTARFECTGFVYTAARNDGWSTIARQFRVSLAALLDLNRATLATMLHPGSQVCLPGSATVPANAAGLAQRGSMPAPPTATTSPSPAATTTTTTTSPPEAPMVQIAQFPVQGPCSYSDTFGADRGGTRTHEGVDILATTGQYVYAVDDGTLTKQYLAATNSLSGNGWRLTRADGTYYFYGHLSAFAAGLTLGSKVVAGQIIGFVGMTGNAGVPHLHIEVHPFGGAAVNPTPVVRAVTACDVTSPPPQPDGLIPAAVV